MSDRISSNSHSISVKRPVFNSCPPHDGIREKFQHFDVASDAAEIGLGIPTGHVGRLAFRGRLASF
jgi:hypothetical protein